MACRPPRPRPSTPTCWPSSRVSGSQAFGRARARSTAGHHFRFSHLKQQARRRISAARPELFCGHPLEKPMATLNQHIMSRRGFCLCCMAASTVAATGGWLSPRQAFAEARNIADLIRDDAAKAPIKVHKLRGNVSILEGSGRNIAVLPAADGKVFIDAGIPVPRPRILEAANGLSRDPVKHLINTHWHFDHTDGNQWLNAEGAAIIAHENTHKHLLVAQRV